MWFIEWLATGLVFYRASQDAGIWMIDQQAMKDYLESFLTVKGAM